MEHLDSLYSMAQQQIHWFPGHMSKALREIEEKIKMVDVVIELLDARAPLSSINEQLENIIKNKKSLVVLTKPDLADSTQTNRWKEELSKRYDSILVLDLTKGSASDQIAKGVNALGKEKWEKQIARGMKPQPIKAMIIGIPNVGKSSLINRLAKRKAAGVQNKPGYTRGEQWIKVSNQFILLDTPGILPMNYENHEKAAKLALIGSIREEILPFDDLFEILTKFLKERYPNALKGRFDIEEISDNPEEIKEQIADRRKLLNARGELDCDRATTLLLKEFKDGLLGPMTLEWL